MKLLAIHTFLLLPVLHAQPDRSSLPACQGPNQEFAGRSYFVLCYNSSLKAPLWTGYEIKPENLHGDSVRPSHFRHDYQLAGPSAYDSDYRNSFFSRGHLVPAADMAWTDAGIRATFLLSNAVPQEQSVNAGKWRQLEDAVCTLAETSDALIIFTGPIFDAKETQFIEPGHIAVPTHMYKVVLALQGNQKTMYAAIIPNATGQREPLNHFAGTVEEVQHRTGLDFFSGLEDGEEQRLESTCHLFQAH